MNSILRLKLMYMPAKRLVKRCSSHLNNAVSNSPYHKRFFFSANSGGGSLNEREEDRDGHRFVSFPEVDIRPASRSKKSPITNEDIFIALMDFSRESRTGARDDSLFLDYLCHFGPRIHSLDDFKAARLTRIIGQSIGLPLEVNRVLALQRILLAVIRFAYDKVASTVRQTLPLASLSGASSPGMLISIVAKEMRRLRIRDEVLLEALALYMVLSTHRHTSAKTAGAVFHYMQTVNYVPKCADQFFEFVDEGVLHWLEVLPLAALNLMLNLVCMQHRPSDQALDKLFEKNMLDRIFEIGAPGSIGLRHSLSLLDMGVQLEHPSYGGGRLPDQYKLEPFGMRHSSKMWLDQEADFHRVRDSLEELLRGSRFYRAMSVLPPGYFVDFEIQLDKHDCPVVLSSNASVQRPEEGIRLTMAGFQREGGGRQEVEHGLLGSPETGQESPSLSGNETFYSTYNDKAKLDQIKNMMSLSEIASLDQEELRAKADSFTSSEEEEENGGVIPSSSSSSWSQIIGKKRVIVLYQSKNSFCSRSDVLIGMAAMKIRHLKALGHKVVQVSCHDLDKLDSAKEISIYLKQKLVEEAGINLNN